MRILQNSLTKKMIVSEYLIYTTMGSGGEQWVEMENLIYSTVETMDNYVYNINNIIVRIRSVFFNFS